jgi:hypothetical protein
MHWAGLLSVSPQSRRPAIRVVVIDHGRRAVALMSYLPVQHARSSPAHVTLRARLGDVDNHGLSRSTSCLKLARELRHDVPAPCGRRPPQRLRERSLNDVRSARSGAHPRIDRWALTLALAFWCSGRSMFCASRASLVTRPPIQFPLGSQINS